LTRLPIVDVRYHGFGRARVGAGGVRFRARQRVEAAFHGVLLVRVAGSPLTVGNVHLTANRDGDWSSSNRHHGFQRAQLDLLRAATHGADSAVLTGDFNVTSGSPLYPSVVEGWRDPFAAGNPPTYQQAMLPPDRPASRIDYILVRGVAEPVATEVLFTDPVPLRGVDGPALLSDHVGLLADVAVSV
jgi:endonuclease/exonuclease/phosphatase family metal-dependent hydrolase